MNLELHPDDDQAVYVISVAAELSGMHPQTLRQYDRMGLVSPGRASGRGRRYSLRDIASLQKFQKHGLRLWSDAYWAQIHSYMGMSGYKRAVLLAMNKDTSELHHEWVDFDLAFYKELRMKALAISTIGEPPERINRSAYYYLCQNCQYKGICHE